MPFAGFEDFEDCVNKNQDKSNPEAFCALLMQRAEKGQVANLDNSVQDNFEGSNSMDENAISIAGPFVLKNAPQRIVTAPVLVPGERDSDGETVTAAKIEEVAAKYMESYGIVDVGHTFNNIGKPVESWVTRTALKFNMPDGNVMEVPKGTWMLSAKILSDPVWNGIQSGEYKGFSVAGLRKADVERAYKSADPEKEFIAALKKTLLRDLGPDWLAVTISVEKNPAVYKSKWVAVKSSTPNFLSRLIDRLNRDKAFKVQNTLEEFDMDEKQMEKFADMLGASVKTAVADAIDEKLGDLPQAKPDEKADGNAASQDTKADAINQGEEKPKTEDISKLDLTSQIAEQEKELLGLLQAEEKDEEKIKAVEAKINTLKQIHADANPPTGEAAMKAMQDEIASLKKQVEGGDEKDKDGKPKVAAKSRAIEGQEKTGTPDSADKGDDPFPRDAAGCRIYPRP